MGVITEAVEKLVGEYIRDRGLVLWFDPERHYEGVVRKLNAGQERVLTFDGSFYKVRLEAEPLLRGLDAPKLLVYLPVAWEQAQEPLAEMLALGVDLRPGVSGNRNTRLAVVARKALKGRVADARLADLDRQIEQGGRSLADGVGRTFRYHSCTRSRLGFSGATGTRRRTGVPERFGRLGTGIGCGVWVGRGSGYFLNNAPGAAGAPGADL